MTQSKFPVAVVGATGLAGQQFLSVLADHPWFEVTRVAASARSAGKTLAQALCTPDGHSQWHAFGAPPSKVMGLTVEDASKMSTDGVACVFAAIESDAAREIEPRFAQDVPVLSTASAFRYEDDVPILLPAVNPDHTALIEQQQKNRNWKGFIVPGPNCTTTGLVHALKPLVDTFGLQSLMMTSMQAVSGGGRSPGVIGLDIIDNVIPYIPKEEEKVEKETKKIFGDLTSTGVTPHDMGVSCTCTRVPVLEGHTEAVFAGLEKPATLDEVRTALQSFGKDRPDLDLPSAPTQWIHVQDDPFRPQPRRDRDNDGGMATTVGRLRNDTVLGNGIKFVLVSHNTQMGAAKGAVLTAEFLHKKGLIGS